MDVKVKGETVLEKFHNLMEWMAFSCGDKLWMMVNLSTTLLTSVQKRVLCSGFEWRCQNGSLW